jgi:hypothetical protein
MAWACLGWVLGAIVSLKMECGDIVFLFCFFKYFFGGFFSFCSYNIQHCFISRPSDFTVPTDAGIEPRTVATRALAVRRSNH